MIRNVFKQKRKINGKTITARTYTARYQVEGMDKPKQQALGVTDKRVAEKRLSELVLKAEREQAGLILPANQVIASQRPTLDHLEDYLDDLQARGKDSQYRSDQRSRVKRLVADCSWSRLNAITPDSFIAWRSASPKHLRKNRPLSAKTLNDYLAAINGLLRFLADAGNIDRNPLAGVKSVKTVGRETFTRRALTADEAGKLLDAAGERYPLYLAALLTSYRRDTLYRLSWSRVDLDGNPPTIRPAVDTLKNGEEHAQPLRDDLAAALRDLKPDDAQPTDRVFNGLLPRWGVAFLEADLTRAGVSIETTDGRIDFHALRHTAATWAGQVAPSEAIARKLTGHKTESQFKRYLHDEHLSVRSVLDAMPRFERTHIRTHEMDTAGPDATSPVTPSRGDDVAKRLDLQEKRPDKASTDTPCHTGEKVTPTGFEPVLLG